MSDGIFEQYQPARWEVGSFSQAFPVIEIRERWVNVLAKHKRPYRRGARLDDLYEEARQWTILTDFYNGQKDTRVDGSYPDGANALLGSFAIHETGWLTLPTIGAVRARAESYDRVEASGRRDVAGATLVFVEDNEDDQQASQFIAPRADTVASTYVVQMVEEMERIGLDGDPLGEIQALCDDLKKLAASPGAFASSVENRIAQTVRSIAQVEEGFVRAGSEAQANMVSTFSDPASARSVILLRQLGETVASSAPVLSQRRRVVTRAWTTTMSIFAIAREVKQDPVELCALNADMPDLGAIPAKTRVRIFVDAQAV